MTERMSITAWSTKLDAAMTEKTIDEGAPRSWMELPESDRENIAALTYALHCKGKYFGVDSAVEFIWSVGRKLAQMPLPKRSN